MSQLDDFLATIPLDQLAAQLGVSTDEAGAALREAAPALLAGMQANAADPAGAASLQAALGQHDGSLLDGLDLGALDTADGSKIVGHIFGANEQQVVNQLSGAKGLSSGTLMKLLPMLAPLIMAFLSKAMKGGRAKAPSTAPSAPSASSASPGTGFPGPGSSSGGRGFPGPSNPTSTRRPAGDDDDDQSSGGGLGDILGGLLGGGAGGAGGGLGDILGGLLGGGRK